MSDIAIKLNAQPEQLDLIDRAAYLLGKSCSDFILEAACERAHSVVLDQVFGNSESDRFMQFIAALEAPAGANPGLDRLMSVRPPWHQSHK